MQRHLHHALAMLCIGLTLLASVLWYLQLNGDLALLFHADADYLPALYRDLVQQGGRISQWNLTPAPSFFPDWPMYFLANWLFSDFFYALPAFFVLQGMLLFGLSAWLLRTVTDARQAAVIAAVACVLVFYWAMQAVVPYSYFYLSAFHCGVFLLSLLSLRLQHAQQHWLLGVVAMLAALSDRLYLVQYSLPAVATLVCLRWRQGLPWKRPAAAILAGSLLGMQLYKWVARPIQLPWRMSLDAVPTNLPALQAMLAQTWHSAPLCGLILAAYYGVLAVLLPGTLLGRGWRIQHPLATRLALFSCLSVAASLAAVLVSDHLFTVRYFIPLYVLPLLAGPLLLYTSLAERWHRDLTAMLLAVAGWGTLAMLQPAVRDLGKLQPAYYPADVACMDQVIAHYGLQRGVASYWDAKRVALLSKHHPVIASYAPDLTPLHWITTASVFQGPYDFALVRHEPSQAFDITHLIRLNGAPLARVSCDTFEVVAFARGGLKAGLK